MDKVLCNIKDFETAIDGLQESQKDYYNRRLSTEDVEILCITNSWLRILKICIEAYRRQSVTLNGNLNELQTDFIDFDLAACVGCTAKWLKLRSTVQKWHQNAMEGTRKGNKSLLELAKYGLLSNERLETLNMIKTSTIELGIRLFQILLLYVSLFAQSEQDEMKKVLNLIQETIRFRCCVKNSLVNCGFVSVVD